ncbi:class I SAM-dependent methyltransferase [Candidatus Dependentiae bacterium]|nr:class I SAM-dependent methyltransferase [Candidatus Dependentiae bacterium]
MGLYENSWSLYKAHSEAFKDDFEFYTAFCRGYSTLELFAGYGRLTNHLVDQGINVDVVELEPAFMPFIKLDAANKYTCDVLKFTTDKRYERIIAAYNSFCLFTDENDARVFFSKLDELLVPGGMACLSYFDTDYWSRCNEAQQFKLNDNTITVTFSWDLSRRDQGFAVWKDHYRIEDSDGEVEEKTFDYPVRVYNERHPITRFFAHTNLELVREVRDFGLPASELTEQGWIDYVLRKRL